MVQQYSRDLKLKPYKSLVLFENKTKDWNARHNQSQRIQRLKVLNVTNRWKCTDTDYKMTVVTFLQNMVERVFMVWPSHR